MSGRSATVWCEAQRVGGLREDGGRIRFAYDRNWLDEGFPLSLSLPFAEQELDAHDFFAGLLPEAAARQRACREHRLPEADDFGLLLALGRDCAGCFVVLPSEESSEKSKTEPPQPSVAITDEDLLRLVASRGAFVPEASEHQRFSLAGAQDKLAVRFTGRKMWLPDTEQPSTHILKFETHKFVCLSEFLAHELARRVSGLDVVATRYIKHAEGPYLLIERYDRALNAQEQTQRLHQEDMTQALGVPSSRKYEEDGGPTLSDVARLLRQRTARPIVDVARLRDWQLFNYLIGNYDGHAKNLALLYPARGSVPALAPFYDLVCLEFMYRVGVRYPRKMAFLIAGKATPEEIRKEDWSTFAKAMQLPPQSVLARLRELAIILPDIAKQTREAFAQEHGDQQVLDLFEETIRDRCSWTLRSVG